MTPPPVTQAQQKLLCQQDVFVSETTDPSQYINILKITKLESVGGEGPQSTVRGLMVNR